MTYKKISTSIKSLKINIFSLFRMPDVLQCLNLTMKRREKIYYNISKALRIYLGGSEASENGSLQYFYVI